MLVDGAMCHRRFGPAEPFTAALRDAYTVVTYDRRGRGESGDSSTYRPELEVDDLRAVIDTVGGTPYVLGFSSGAGLAYRAAAAGVPMAKLIGYEAPYVGLRGGRDYVADLDRLIAEGKNGKAVDYFMVKMVGAPFFVPVMFRLMGKLWGQMKQIAPTLRYDARVMGGDFEVPDGGAGEDQGPGPGDRGAARRSRRCRRPTPRSPRPSRVPATASWRARPTT